MNTTRNALYACCLLLILSNTSSADEAQAIQGFQYAPAIETRAIPTDQPSVYVYQYGPGTAADVNGFSHTAPTPEFGGNSTQESTYACGTVPEYPPSHPQQYSKYYPDTRHETSGCR